MPCSVQSAPRGHCRQKSNVRKFSPVLCAPINIKLCLDEEMSGSAQTMVEAAMYKEG
jgi:hypothetical protein